jgi:hypothetical protein
MPGGHSSGDGPVQPGGAVPVPGAGGGGIPAGPGRAYAPGGYTGETGGACGVAPAATSASHCWYPGKVIPGPASAKAHGSAGAAAAGVSIVNGARAVAAAAAVIAIPANRVFVGLNPSFDIAG